MRAMRTAFQSMDKNDKTVELYCVGGVRLNEMAREFCSVSEDGFRARKMSISHTKRPESWVREKMGTMDHLAFFKNPGEPNSDLVALADSLKLDAQTYAFK